MNQTKSNRSLYIVILLFANFLPLYLYSQGYWTVFIFFYLYWFETLILSFFSSLKIIFATGHDVGEIIPSQWKRIMSAIKFFIARTFLLLFYLLFLVAFIGFSQADKNDSMKMFTAVFFRDFNFNIAVTGFILSHGFDFIFNYLLSNENQYKKYNAFSLFFDARIIVIHVSIVLSAFALQFSPGSTISGHAVGSYLALFIFVSLKTLVDIFHLPSKNNSRLEMHIHNRY